MTGCNSTDDELEQFRIDLAAERVRRIKELEDEVQTLRDEVRNLQAEKSSLEFQVDRLQDQLDDWRYGRNGE